jgi:L-aminopeptidase/D-esterase-like protein
MKPGRTNSLLDVSGIAVGNAGDEKVLTGVTVILPDRPMVAACDTAGGGPGSRETALLDPESTVKVVHAIVLSGGSALGLDAAGAVANRLRAQGRGLDVGGAIVPLVPSAIIFDLLNGGDKAWGEEAPYRRLALAALEAVSHDELTLGNAGAGMGAKAGKLKGGLGSASLVDSAGFTVAALAVANPLGSVAMPENECFWAWPYERDGEFGSRAPTGRPIADLDFSFNGLLPAQNTTLAVVATDAALDRMQARRIAIMAQDGFARAIRPVHTPLDGDTVFVLAGGERPLADPVIDVARLGMMAADCVARAITRGVYEARSVPGWPAWRDRF